MGPMIQTGIRLSWSTSNQTSRSDRKGNKWTDYSQWSEYKPYHKKNALEPMAMISTSKKVALLAQTMSIIEEDVTDQSVEL